MNTKLSELLNYFIHIESTFHIQTLILILKTNGVISKILPNAYLPMGLIYFIAKSFIFLI